MNWNGYVESESPIVHHIDREEQRRANAPFTERNRRGPNKVTAIGIELVMQCRNTCEHELKESDKKTAGWLLPVIVLVLVLVL